MTGGGRWLGAAPRRFRLGRAVGQVEHRLRDRLRYRVVRDPGGAEAVDDGAGQVGEHGQGERSELRDQVEEVHRLTSRVLVRSAVVDLGAEERHVEIAVDDLALDPQHTADYFH